MKRRFISLAGLGLLFCFSSFQPSEACTLWGAAGQSVEGGGTLIVKNRDWLPDHRQELTVLEGAGAYKSLVLKAVGGAEPGIKAGVNEKGLVIVSAAANQVTSAERKKFQQKKALMGHFLSTCASLQEVLKNSELMRRPVFYMVADRRELAVIEMAPDGRRFVTRKESGTLHHTNHYCAVDAENLRKPGRSSQQRFARIEELLTGRSTPFGAEDFIRFSEDQNDGPDSSIWRIGSDPRKTRSLATWLVSVPPSGSPQLYLKIVNPGELERVYRISAEDAFRVNGWKPVPSDSR